MTDMKHLKVVSTSGVTKVSFGRKKLKSSIFKNKVTYVDLCVRFI